MPRSIASKPPCTTFVNRELSIAICIGFRLLYETNRSIFICGEWNITVSWNFENDQSVELEWRCAGFIVKRLDSSYHGVISVARWCLFSVNVITYWSECTTLCRLMCLLWEWLTNSNICLTYVDSIKLKDSDFCVNWSKWIYLLGSVNLAVMTESLCSA